MYRVVVVFELMTPQTTQNLHPNPNSNHQLMGRAGTLVGRTCKYTEVQVAMLYQGLKALRFVNNVVTEPRYVTELYHGCRIVQNVHECCILFVIMVVKVVAQTHVG